MIFDATGLTFLIVEDHPEHIQLLRDYLRPFGCKIVVAGNGLDGLRLAREERPALIVLDHQLPDLTSDKIIDELRKDRTTTKIPILVFSAYAAHVLALERGANEYVSKAEDMEVFRVRVSKLMERTFEMRQDRYSLTIQATHDQRLAFRASGLIDLVGHSKKLADLEASEISRSASNDLASDDWRFNVSRTSGRAVYEAIFSNEELLSTYHYLRGLVNGDGSRLHLRFECSRAELGVPFEMMVKSGTNHDYQWLALEHPLDRLIVGLMRTSPPLSAGVLRERNETNPLKILLIASNTYPSIPGVDEEVRWLQRNLGQIFAKVGLSLRMTYLPSEKATIQEVRKELKECPYDIVHYAGHGQFVKDDTDKSALFFGSDVRPGTVSPLISTELEELFRGARTSFVYLSCCSGTQGGNVASLQGHDFLGIADALIRAGVPSVLGFRQPVSDAGGLEFSKAFYVALAQKQEIGASLFVARREIHGRMPDDRAWLSPVLIQQA